MQIKTSIHDHEIKDIFIQFRNLIPESNWINRVRKLNEEARGNKFLEQYHFEDNAIVYQFNACSELINKFGALPIGEIDLSYIYPAIAFACHALSITDLMEISNKKSMQKRIAGALRNPEDMRALQLEFTAAHHFSKKGYELEWPEISGLGTFDLFVKNIGPLGLQVECKAISADKGKKISRRKALDFFKFVELNLKPLLKNLKIGLSAVLILPSGLPTEHKEHLLLAKKVGNAILANQSLNTDEFQIVIKEFSPRILESIEKDSNYSNHSEIIESITGIPNLHSIALGAKGGGAICLAVQSLQDDALFESIKVTAKKAAESQLANNRPGLILLEFSGLSSDEMLNLAAHDKTLGNAPTALRKWASDFLANNSIRNHIIGIGFLSRGEMTRPDATTVVSSGTTYLFPRKESPLWDDSFNGLFAET